MSIKKIRPKRSRVSSNLIVRMMDDRMGPDKMSDERGPGSIGRIQRSPLPSSGQSNAAQNKKSKENG
jgi:hypothetical protein